MTDVFLDIDGQPNESLSIISERLEARSLSGKFQEFTKKYFDLIEVDNHTNILELGGGTGVIGRNFIESLVCNSLGYTTTWKVLST